MRHDDERQRSPRHVTTALLSQPAVEPASLLERYLAELGERPAPPRAEALIRLQRAHVLRFAHDTFWKHRGRAPALDQMDLVRAVVEGEGGACVHLNAAFVWLLRELGYDAKLHRSRVQRGFETTPGPRIDAHPVISVTLDGLVHHCDVGLGNGPLEPIPRVEGNYVQGGGFTYRLERSPEPGRWIFHHARRLAGVRLLDIEEDPAELADFTFSYDFDLYDPESTSLLRHLSANRRREDGVLTMVGRTLIWTGVAGRELRHIESAEEWEAILRNEFGLRLPGLGEAERDLLWQLADR